MTKQNGLKAPPLKDPSWAESAAPTRAYLSRPRTWAEMNAWRKAAKIGPFMLRHFLAYLEFAGQARSFTDQEGVVFWVRVSSGRSEPPPSQAKAASPGISDEALLRQLLPDHEDELPEPEPQEEADERSE